MFRISLLTNLLIYFFEHVFGNDLSTIDMDSVSVVDVEHLQLVKKDPHHTAHNIKLQNITKY